MAYIGGEGKGDPVFFKLINKLLDHLVQTFFQGASPYPEKA